MAFLGRPRRLGGAATSECGRDFVASGVASGFDLLLGFLFNGGALSGVDGIEGQVESAWLTRVDKGCCNEQRSDGR